MPARIKTKPISQEAEKALISAYEAAKAKDNFKATESQVSIAAANKVPLLEAKKIWKKAGLIAKRAPRGSGKGPKKAKSKNSDLASLAKEYDSLKIQIARLSEKMKALLP